MATFHFFTNAGTMSQDAAQKYGPVDGSETTKFQITSLFSSQSLHHAYAVCAGKVFAQEAGGRINLVLKPDAQPSGLTAPVKYFIYKGLRRHSIVDAVDGAVIADAARSDLADVIHKSQQARNNAFDRLMQAPPGTTTTLPPISAVGLHLTADAAAPNNLPDGALLDEVFQRIDDDEFPTVRGGDSLGEFESANFGFEVVLDGLGAGPALRSVRSAATIVTAGAGGATEAARFRDDARREEILDSIDPCAFYATFFFDGVAVKQSPGDPFKTLTRDALHAAVLAKFRTADLVYLDIRNDHNHSLNFYRNYSSAPNQYAQIHIRYDGVDAGTLDYHYAKWPILAVRTSAFTSADAKKPSTVSIHLPRGDNLAPILLRTQGYFFAGFRRMSRRPDVSEIFRPLIVQADDFTAPIAFSLPKLADNTTAPSYIGIRYLKRVGFTSAPADSTHRVLNAEHPVDNLFELTSLVNDEGLIIPLNTNDVSRWHATGRRAVIAPDDAGGFAHLAGIGLGDDVNNAYFFAYAPAASWVTDSSNSVGPLQSLGDAHGLNLELRQVLVPDALTTHVSVPISLEPPPPFAEPAGRRPHFDIDERAVVALALDRAELSALRTAAQSLEDGFDKRIGLRNRVDSKDGNGIVTASQYDLAIAGYRLSSTVSVEEVDTQVKVRHAAGSEYRLASPAALENFLPFDPVDANRRRFSQSRIAKGTIVRLRSSPRVEKSDTNLLCETDGQEHRLTVLGKLKVENDNKDADPNSTETVAMRIWYYVELLDALTTSAFATLPKGRRCWIASDLTIVSSFRGFIADLILLNDSIDDQQSVPEPLTARLTRLRMRTKERGEFSDMFDDIINAPALAPPAVVRLGEASEMPPVPTVRYDTYDLETSIRLFDDYMGVILGQGRLIDLHHLFIGMDVVNHENPDTHVYVIFPLGNNVDATTWAGDVAAIPTDYLEGVDKSWETKWRAAHPDASDHDTAVAFIDHYWETRAKDDDLTADVYCHLVREHVLRQVAKDPNERNVAAMLFYCDAQLRREGDDRAFRLFEKRLGLKPNSAVGDPNYASVVAKAKKQIFDFSFLWDWKRTGVPADVSRIDTLMRWSEALAIVFLRWLERRR